MKGLALDTSSVGQPRRSVTSIMLHVMVALLPGMLLYTLLIDARLPVNLCIAVACALVFEAALLKLRKRPALTIIKDGSIALAAILLVLSVPQSLPVWQLVLGVFVLCALGKHLFGGLGHNPFNPAMVAYALLIVSFPLTMTQWSSDYGLLDPPIAQHDVKDQTETPAWDGLTGATPLDRLDTLRREIDSTALTGIERTSPKSTIDTSASGTGTAVTNTVHTGTSADAASALIISSDWFWLSVTWLLGGVYLLLMRIIGWRIPVSMLASLWCLYLLWGLASSGPVLPATVALFSGAIMLGAFFIATDPVSAATSNPGKLVYATGIGVLCFIIREFSAYPEGVAFAVLLMNMCVPLIDHVFTRNRLHETTHATADKRSSSS